jgi:hypothetical protein
MSLLKDTGACAFDGVTLLLKLIADKQMKHAKTSLLVNSSPPRTERKGNPVKAGLQLG